MGRFGRIGAALAVAMGLAATGAQAALIMNVTKDANGAYAEFGGSIDLAGLPEGIRLGYYPGSAVRFNNVFLKGYLFAFGAPVSTAGPSYSFSGPDFSDVINLAIFGSSLGNTTIGSGAPVMLQDTDNAGSYFVLSDDYVSGSYVRGSTAWAVQPTQDLEALGYNLGSYLFTLANGETVTLNIGNDYAQALPEVPLPAGLPLLAAGLGGLALLRRKRG
jgi:hypothetical protein